MEFVRTFNRTILELKYATEGVSLPSEAPSIAPYWNWNRKSEGSKKKVESFNRTILEMKFRIQSGLNGGFYGPSIAPYWNWNAVLPHFLHSISGPSIAPYWNWNIATIEEIIKHENAFNRTILELKLRCYSTQPLTCVPSIAPYWNWN